MALYVRHLRTPLRAIALSDLQAGAGKTSGWQTTAAVSVVAAGHAVAPLCEQLFKLHQRRLGTAVLLAAGDTAAVTPGELPPVVGWAEGLLGAAEAAYHTRQQHCHPTL